MVIRVEEELAPFSRDDLFRFLEDRGIETKRYFSPPVHQLDVYRRKFGDSLPRLPVTEKISRAILALPLFTHISEDSIREICRGIHSWAGRP